MKRILGWVLDRLAEQLAGRMVNRIAGPIAGNTIDKIVMDAQIRRAVVVALMREQAQLEETTRPAAEAYADHASIAATCKLAGWDKTTAEIFIGAGFHPEAVISMFAEAAGRQVQ